MHWSLGLFTLLFVWLSSPQQAFADILFVNLNGSVKEIPAVQVAARQMGENVYVLPAQATTTYNTQQLADDLVRLANQGVRPHTMIVSGHHVKNEGFFGSVSTDGVALYAVPNLVPDTEPVQEFFAGIQSIYLWGCYTGTLNSVSRLLNGTYPAYANIKFIVGFADKAPLSTEVLSGQTLKEFLLKESQFRAASPQQMSSLLTTISSYNKYDFILHKGGYFLTKDGISTQANFIESCQSDTARDNLDNAVKLIWKYYWNEAGPIPDDTSKGPLRQAYRQLQRNNFCINMGVVKLNNVDEIPPLPTVIRLIFYKNVMHNFTRVYAAQLAYAKQELQGAGLQDVDFIAQMEQTDRGTLIKKFENMHKYIKDNFYSDVNIDKRTNYIYFSTMVDDFESVVFPSEDYVPQSWIETASSEKAWFPVLNDFAKAKSQSRAKAASVVTQ